MYASGSSKAAGDSHCTRKDIKDYDSEWAELSKFLQVTRQDILELTNRLEHAKNTCMLSAEAFHADFKYLFIEPLNRHVVATRSLMTNSSFSHSEAIGKIKQLTETLNIRYALKSRFLEDEQQYLEVLKFIENYEQKFNECKKNIMKLFSNSCVLPKLVDRKPISRGMRACMTRLDGEVARTLIMSKEILENLQQQKEAVDRERNNK